MAVADASKARPAKTDRGAFCDWLARQDGVEAIAIDTPFFAVAARSLADFLQRSSPDASAARILVGNDWMRRELIGGLRSLHSAPTTLFGLEIATLRQWALAHLPPATVRYCDDDEALLELAMRIRDHGGVRYNPNHWQFATALIDLFGHLEQHRIGDAQLDTAVRGNSGAWRLNESNYLAIEARIAKEIWSAWRSDLANSGRLGVAGAYNEALDSHARLKGENPCWILAPEEPIAAEQDFLLDCLQLDCCHIVVCDRSNSPAHAGFAGSAAKSGPFRHRWLHECFVGADEKAGPAGDTGMAREPELASQAPCQEIPTPAHSPAFSKLPRIELLSCVNDARQIEAITSLVGDASGGGGRVGIISHDRRFARALGASMASRGLQLLDRGGWALSTTHSGTLVWLWLNVIDSDLGYKEVFALLRGGMACFARHYGSALHSLDHLRRTTADSCQIRFDSPGPEERPKPGGKERSPPLDKGAQAWIALIHRASAKLLARKRQRLTLPQWLELIEESIGDLGLLDFLIADGDEEGGGAGLMIVERLRRLMRSPSLADCRLGWNDLLDFIKHQLEHNRFLPPAAPGKACAELLQLGHVLPRYDLLIFAALDQDRFPGRSRVDLLFNDDIYLQLGLPAPQQDREQRLKARFIEALLTQESIVFCHNTGGEEALPSPWLSQFIDHCERQGIALGDGGRLDSLEAQWRASIDYPPRAPTRPSVEQGPMPSSILTVGGYQSLVNCPYQHFLGARLGAREIREGSEAMRPDIYGQLAHKCLSDFHTLLIERQLLPLEGESLEIAAKQAAAIVDRAFASWLRGSLVNMVHKLRMRRTMDIYCQWLAERGYDGVEGVEKDIDTVIRAKSGKITVKGRIDYVLRRGDNVSLVDFKSGSGSRSIKAIVHGEDVQLLTYALDRKEAEEIFYLHLVSGDFQAPLQLKMVAVPPGKIAELREFNRQRLARLAEDFSRRHKLVALADDGVCANCAFETVCRPREWSGAV